MNISNEPLLRKYPDGVTAKARKRFNEIYTNVDNALSQEQSPFVLGVKLQLSKGDDAQMKRYRREVLGPYLASIHPRWCPVEAAELALYYLWLCDAPEEWIEQAGNRLLWRICVPHPRRVEEVDSALSAVDTIMTIWLRGTLREDAAELCARLSSIANDASLRKPEYYRAFEPVYDGILARH